MCPVGVDRIVLEVQPRAIGLLGQVQLVVQAVAPPGRERPAGVDGLAETALPLSTGAVARGDVPEVAVQDSTPLSWQSWQGV
jgi:hypothetical protein